MNQNKNNTLTEKITKNLKRLSPWIIICFIPYCLNIGGVIKWRNENSFKGHIRALYDIIVTALDNDEIIKGINLAMNEFIFNFTSSGAWIKFIISIVVVIVAIKVLICLISRIPGMIKAVISTGKTAGYFLRNIKRTTKKINILESLECSLRYHLIPNYSNHHSIICLSTSIDDIKFFGGVKANIIKFPKLHLISYNGTETDRLLDNPVLIVQTSSGVFLCGHGLIDENGTIQRKIKLSHNTQEIKIGKHTYEIYIEER